MPAAYHHSVSAGQLPLARGGTNVLANPHPSLLTMTDWCLLNLGVTCRRHWWWWPCQWGHQTCWQCRCQLSGGAHAHPTSHLCCSPLLPVWPIRLRSFIPLHRHIMWQNVSPAPAHRRDCVWKPVNLIPKRHLVHVCKQKMTLKPRTTKGKMVQWVGERDANTESGLYFPDLLQLSSVTSAKSVSFTVS